MRALHRASPDTLLAVVALAAVFALPGCGARSEIPEPEREPKCGDEIVDPGEECDGGGITTWSLVLLQGAFSRAVRPIDTAEGLSEFYSYSSSSGHTGYEAAGKSELFFHRTAGSPLATLVTEHGIDIDATGVDQPETDVEQTFTGLPPGASIAIWDDNEKEIFLDSPTSARGNWHFLHNTDGAAIIGFPLPGDWQVDVTSKFGSGIGALRYFDGDGTEIPLDPTQTVSLRARTIEVDCRADCTLPRCGDGIVDPSEACDDGNTQGGDGCGADCTAQ